MTGFSYKIYNDKEYVAATKYAEDASFIVAALGEGTKVKVNGRIVWREGQEVISAWESCDRFSEIVRQRVREHHLQSYDKYVKLAKQHAALVTS